MGVSLSKQKGGGLFASIFSKQKRIYAAIPNAKFTMKAPLGYNYNFFRKKQYTLYTLIY